MIDVEGHFREQAQAGRRSWDTPAGADLLRDVHILDDVLVRDALDGHFGEGFTPEGRVQVPAVQAVDERFQGSLLHREIRPEGLHQVIGAPA